MKRYYDFRNSFFSRTFDYYHVTDYRTWKMLHTDWKSYPQCSQRRVIRVAYARYVMPKHRSTVLRVVRMILPIITTVAVELKTACGVTSKMYIE